MARAKRQQRRTIDDEISDTEGKPPHEMVPVPIRMLRSLYLHALYACRNGDYPTVSQYVADLIRRDKHVKSSATQLPRLTGASIDSIATAPIEAGDEPESKTSSAPLSTV